MGILRRFLPFIGSALVIAILEGVAAYPEFWQWWVVAVFVAIVATGIAMTNFERVPKGWWHTLLAPLLLSVSALFLILFVSTDFARHFVALASGGLLLFFWENLWRFYWALDRYHNEALENTSLALTTTTIWFTCMLFYHILLDPGILPPFFAANILFILTLIVLLMVIGLDFGTIWVQRYPPEKVLLWLIATALILSEVFWVTNFLPHRVEVKTFLVVLVYYLLTHIGRGHLDGTLTPRGVRRYGYLASLTLLAVLLTARWLV